MVANDHGGQLSAAVYQVVAGHRSADANLPWLTE
jgi:hypothetical protein